MILGIGTDIVKIERIKKAIERTPGFMNAAFNETEIMYLKSKGNKDESIAATFAVKEAVSKALGTGFRGFGLHDIEVMRDSLGKPSVNLSEKLIKMFKLKNYTIHISISHTTDDAIAFAILEGECDGFNF